MTLDDVARDLIHCLAAEGDTLISWDQVQHWPQGAIDLFQGAGWIMPAPLATEVTCPGCEESCFVSVAKMLRATNDIPARAYIACDQRSDMGTVKFHPDRLQQWQLTYGQLAHWTTRMLGLKYKAERGGSNGRFKLGSLQSNERIGKVELDPDNPVSVCTSGHSLPLSELISIEGDQLSIDQLAILNMVDLPPASEPKPRKTPQKPAVELEGLEVGSPEWRSQNARNAANARHDQPGGSRDKQQQMRDIWTTGKYSTRDICAEQECAALDMSFSAARKALRNTPKPKSST